MRNLRDHFVLRHVSRGAGGETSNLIKHRLHVVPDLVRQFVVNQEQSLNIIIVTGVRSAEHVQYTHAGSVLYIGSKFATSSTDISESVNLLPIETLKTCLLSTVDYICNSINF